MTNECKCNSIAKIVKSVAYSSVVVLSCSASAHEVAGLKNGSLTLFLITVLSYQPVEFSRRTLPPLPLSGDRRTEESGGGSVFVFSLWYLFLIFQSLDCNRKKQKQKTLHQNIPDIDSFAILNYPKKKKCCGEYRRWASILTVQISITQLAWVLFIFVFPIFCPPPPKKNINRMQIMKHWNPFGMHVLHIVPEMCFGVVEIHVLKKKKRLVCMCCFFFDGGGG